MIDFRSWIEAYVPGAEEETFRADTIKLLNVSPDCFYRTYFSPGHITGSGLLVSRDGSQVLLNHHKSLNKWLCFGGHADGDMDMYRVAERELIEETGIKTFKRLGDGIFDLDVHSIPANPAKDEPGHLHFDIRFLFQAEDDAFICSDESIALKWFDFDKASGLATSSGMKRLLRKTENAFS